MQLLPSFNMKEVGGYLDMDPSLLAALIRMTRAKQNGGKTASAATVLTAMPTLVSVAVTVVPLGSKAGWSWR